MPPRALAALGLATLLALAAAPSTGLGLTPQIEGDDGNPIAITPGLTIRNVGTAVRLQVAPNEAAVRLTITGPDGQPAPATPGCLNPAGRQSIDYRGNGTYTVAVQAFTAAGCATAAGPAITAQFTINAGVTLGPAPAARALTRSPGGFVTADFPLPIGLPPGSSFSEVRYARNATLGPDGSIQGESQLGFVQAGNPNVTGIRLDTPGVWTIVARSRGLGSVFTPWSAPVQVTAFAPFDFDRNGFTDSRGPTYGYRVRVREPSARGRVTVSIARGNRGGSFRTIGRFRITPKRFVAFTFRQSGAGVYRLRFRFNGSATVAAGTVTQRIRITRTVVFR